MGRPPASSPSDGSVQTAAAPMTAFAAASLVPRPHAFPPPPSASEAQPAAETRCPWPPAAPPPAHVLEAQPAAEERAQDGPPPKRTRQDAARVLAAARHWRSRAASDAARAAQDEGRGVIAGGGGDECHGVLA
eukprot:9473836-Pyramimonas_sp.AAC.1